MARVARAETGDSRQQRPRLHLTSTYKSRSSSSLHGALFEQRLGARRRLTSEPDREAEAFGILAQADPLRANAKAQARN